MGVLLAAIDHNMHLFHKPKQSKRGRIVATGNYSKELNVHGEVVKEEKDYRYFQYMSARMFKTRADFQGIVSSKIPNTLLEFPNN